MNGLNFKAIIEKKKVIYGYDDSVLAKVLGCSLRTFQRKKKAPEDFTFGEVKILLKFLRFTEEEKEEVFLA